MNTKERNRTQTGPSRRTKSPDAQGAKRSEPKVRYTPAKTFNRNRFLLHLATVAAVVLAVVFGMSIFFKANRINVSGATKYTPWEIREASGIQDGDALLSLSDAKISANIRAKLPYVGDVRVGIKLPDTVNIEITELEVVYAAEAVDGSWWLLDSTGRVVDRTDAATAKNHTRIIGVRIHNAQIGEPAKAAEPETSDETQAATGVTVPTQPSVPAAQLLNTVVQVLTALENNGVMGVIDSVDVSDSETILLWYENRYQVSLGDTSRLDYKVGAMKSSIKEMGQYQTGYLDVSFTIWPNEVGYRPFDGK